MNSAGVRIHSLLDEAMSELNDTNHEALVLRFFENHDLRTVGHALGVSDDTAQKRVSRALEKLREHVADRGLKTTATALSATISAKAVQAAPVGLIATLSSGALGNAGLPAPAGLALTKSIAMTVMQKTIIGAAMTAAIAVGVYEARRAYALGEQVRSARDQQFGLADKNAELTLDRAELGRRLEELRGQNELLSRNSTEILKLRAEVARLESSDKSAGVIDSTEMAMKS